MPFFGLVVTTDFRGAPAGTALTGTADTTVGSMVVPVTLSRRLEAVTVTLGRAAVADTVDEGRAAWKVDAGPPVPKIGATADAKKLPRAATGAGAPKEKN